MITIPGHHIAAVYTDGGIIGPNNGAKAGTWAFCYVDAEGKRIYSDSGLLIAGQGDTAECEYIGNNLTELYAMVRALEALPVGAMPHIYSDSKNTLGRMFRYWSLKGGVTHEIRERVLRLRRRTFELGCTLLDGHPTPKQLEEGRGKRGGPVSKWNVWCDKECNRQRRLYEEASNF